MTFANPTTIAHKRALLIALCAAQRDEVGALMGRLEGPLKIADRGISIARYLRARPLALVAISALAAATRGHGAWKWARRGFVAWRAYRALGK